MRVLIPVVLMASTVAAQEVPHGGFRAEGSAPTVPHRLERPRITPIEATTPVRVDGALDDEVWRRAVVATGFVQSEPQDGAPASQMTEVRLAYDRDNLYIAAYCHDAAGDQPVVNDIRKDFKPDNQDTFEVILDTFGDRRNGFIFITNRAGAKSDQQMANEGKETNASWDAVWFVETRAVDDGWTAEMAIPFRSLRFDPADNRTWGINFSRRLRARNEIDFWAPVPRAYTLSRVSLAGELVGLPAPSPGRNFRLKPYAAAKTIRGTQGGEYDSDAAIGVDLKYGVTPALTLDVTLNPDFAQAEADEQQVNLTQFSQFFPEKRDFFLENSGTFYVGDAARTNRVNPTPTPDEDLLLFFSRRIGLRADGTPMPILGGARLTGQALGASIGALTVQTRESKGTPATNYSVLRARRNLSASSDVGVLVMTRQSTRRGDYNRVYGMDTNVRLGRDVDWSSYAVKTSTPGVTDGQYAWRTSLNREGNFFHGKGGVMAVGAGFNDELGFFRRTSTRKYFLDVGVRPRPAFLQKRGVREMHPHAVWNYYTDLSGRVTGKRLHNGYSFFLNDGGNTEFSVNPAFEELTAPLSLSARIPPVAAGRYGWTEYQLRYNTDPSRRFAVSLTGIVGGLWSGEQKTLNVGMTFQPSYRFRATLGLQRTDATLDRPKAAFVTNLWTARANYSFSRDMFLDSLVQYNGDLRQFNANLRFNFIHHPLSDLFVVYNEQRFTSEHVPPGRGVIVKLTRSLAF